MNETTLALVAMTVAVVLPLLPAFLLFKFLPSSGDASGPLQGLNVKFGGAFAGYLVVFLALLAVRPTDFSHYHTWTVTGQINFVHPSAEDDPNINDVFVRFIPPRLGLMHQGAFAWEIPVVEKDGVLHFPDLQIDLRGYRGLTVPLGPNRPYGSQNLAVTYDHKGKVISLTQPLTMQSVKQGQAYTEAAAATAQIVR